MPIRPFIIIAILLLLILALAATGLLWSMSASAPIPTDPPIEIRRPVPAQPSASTTGPARFTPVFRGRELQLLERGFFRIGYDNQRRNPAWVSYDLDGPIIHAEREPTRPATFATDFQTSAHVAHRDYTGSGYDRGHLCPAFAAWSRHGQEGFTATFIMSNIIPQFHGLNAGLWEDLEDDIAGRCKNGQAVDHGYAGRFRNITVINGPVYSARPEMLRGGTWIPAACFSIVLDYQEDLGTYRALAFLIPNQPDVSGPLGRHLTTIRTIEDRTGLDIFAGQEAVRSQVEGVLAERVW